MRSTMVRLLLATWLSPPLVRFFVAALESRMPSCRLTDPTVAVTAAEPTNSECSTRDVEADPLADQGSEASPPSLEFCLWNRPCRSFPTSTRDAAAS